MRHKQPTIEKKTSKSHKAKHPHHYFVNSTKKNSIKRGITRNDKRNLLIGLSAAGIAGAAAFLIFTTRSPKKKTFHDLYETYDDFKDDAQEFAHNAYEKGKRAYSVASDIAETVKDGAYELIEHPTAYKGLALASIAGTALGATALYFLLRNSNEIHTDGVIGKAQKYLNNFKEATDEVLESDWATKLKGILALISEKANISNENEEEDRPKMRKKRSDHLDLDHIIELGLAGLKLFKNFRGK